MISKRKILGIIVVTIVLFTSLSCSPIEKNRPVEIQGLSITYRTQTRVDPYIFYAFKDAAKKIDPSLVISIVVINPFLYEANEEGEKMQKESKALLDLAYKCVSEVVAIKESNPQTERLLVDIHRYIQDTPKSYLAKLSTDIENLMKNFQFLIIEASYTYGIHHIFYTAGVTKVDTPDGGCAKDIIEALYDFFLIDAAFKQNKVVYGTCHGAQAGYVHAGGRLARLFDYNEDGYDVQFKKSSQIDNETETWHIKKMLFTQKDGTNYIKYGMAAYPVPEIYKDKKDKNKLMYINKDFEHSLAMVEPVPEDIEVISYHPLSQYKERIIDERYEEFNKDFNRVLKDQVIIDAYKYKTMLGTQYHPQFTYDDLDTSIVFEYLIKQIAHKCKK